MSRKSVELALVSRAASKDVSSPTSPFQVQVNPTDSRLDYSGSDTSDWSPITNSGNQVNDNDRDAKIANKADASVRFPFTGDQLILTLLSPNNQSYMASLVIDGGDAQQVLVLGLEKQRQDFNFNHLPCGNHTAVLTSRPGNASLTLDGYSYFEGPCPSNNSASKTNPNINRIRLPVVVICILLTVISLGLLSLLFYSFLRKRRKKRENALRLASNNDPYRDAVLKGMSGMIHRDHRFHDNIQLPSQLASYTEKGSSITTIQVISRLPSPSPPPSLYKHSQQASSLVPTTTVTHRQNESDVKKTSSIPFDPLDNQRPSTTPVPRRPAKSPLRRSTSDTCSIFTSTSWAGYIYHPSDELEMWTSTATNSVPSSPCIPTHHSARSITRSRVSFTDSFITSSNPNSNRIRSHLSCSSDHMKEFLRDSLLPPSSS